MKEYQPQNNNGSKTIQDFNRQCAKQRTQFSNSPPKKHQKRVHNYIIETNSLLGEGSFSSVYYAKNIKTNADVAIKVIKLKTIAKTGIERLFSEQLNIIQQLKHPNIVACHEYFRTNNNCYTVYHFCKGGDLAQLLQKGHLGERQDLHQANTLIKDIFQGLLYLETMNIVHRDIKAANIFIDHGKAKIGDFGFATRCTSEFKDASIGSPAYMAPEALLHSIYGPKTDVWAFGMLLFQMLHGHSPFFECASQRQLRARISIPLNWDQLKANLPSPLKRLILKCLKIDPDERSTFSQLLNDQYIQKIYAESPMNRIWNKSSYSKKTADTDQLMDSATLSITSKHSRKRSKANLQQQEKVSYSEPGLYERAAQINIQDKIEQYSQQNEYQNLATQQFQQNAVDKLQSKPTFNLQKTQLTEYIFLQRQTSSQLQTQQSQQFLQIITILISTYQLSFLIDHKQASQTLFENLINQLSQQLYAQNKLTNPTIANKTAQLYETTNLDIDLYYQLPNHQSKHDLYKLGSQYLFTTIKMVENLIDKQDISCSNANSKSTLSSTLVLYGNHLILCYHIFDHLAHKTSPAPTILTSKTKPLTSSEQFYIWLYELQLQRMELTENTQFQ